MELTSAAAGFAVAYDRAAVAMAGAARRDCGGKDVVESVWNGYGGLCGGARVAFGDPGFCCLLDQFFHQTGTVL